MKKWIIVVLILVSILLISGYIFIFRGSSLECKIRGGIIREAPLTLDGENIDFDAPFCMDNEADLGRVWDLMCLCHCCKPVS